MGLDAPQRKVSELSRGMGMKLQLACVLASGAELLLLDEPTSGLDPIVREEVLDILRTWMEDEGHSMLVSSHITSDLEHLADYLVMIEQGQVVLACERDLISDMMGVAQLRADELEQVRAAWPFGQAQMRVIDHGLYKSLLVPSRTSFHEAFPDYACDRASIDDVMNFIVKGKVS
jgi:ABC-2 type transport system ATP-binding protein